jgi:hypothetical protein
MCYVGTRKKNDEPSDMVRIFVFCKGHYSWNFTRMSLNRKEIQRVVIIPLMPKISFEAYLHIPVSKAEEGNYESYNLQGVYLCILSLCCCWDRG